MWGCNLGPSQAEARTFSMERILSENHEVVRNPHCRKQSNSLVKSFSIARKALQPTTSATVINGFALSSDTQHSKMSANITPHSYRQFTWSSLFSMCKNKSSIPHCQSMPRLVKRNRDVQKALDTIRSSGDLSF